MTKSAELSESLCCGRDEVDTRFGDASSVTITDAEVLEEP
jgi:hypothetical protein